MRHDRAPLHTMEVLWHKANMDDASVPIPRTLSLRRRWLIRRLAESLARHRAPRARAWVGGTSRSHATVGRGCLLALR
jgi:hypothetical protein